VRQEKGSVMAKNGGSILAYAFLTIVLALAAACGGERPGLEARSPGEGKAIARFHKSRCGACHMRVEPGERSRTYLEEALTRHRKRVRASEAEWADLVDYLSASNEAQVAKARLTE
jgi:hypothetical protein